MMGEKSENKENSKKNFKKRYVGLHYNRFFFSFSFSFFPSFKEKLKALLSPDGGLSMDVSVWKIIFILHFYGLFYNVWFCLVRRKEELWWKLLIFSDIAPGPATPLTWWGGHGAGQAPIIFLSLGEWWPESICLSVCLCLSFSVCVLDVHLPLLLRL